MLVNGWLTEDIEATYFTVEVPSAHEDGTLLRRGVFRQSSQWLELTTC